jgi:chromosome segregation ATPase|tara:strand:- start:395 stop:727 length:333 start_codon:yes stop_codon:yes gene_type:complete
MNEGMKNLKETEDLSDLIEQHKREIWEYKEKEMQWIRDKNQLDGNKRIVEELSAQIVELRKRLAEALEIDESHQKLNGKIQERLTEVEHDNKYLSEKIETYRDMLRKAGL